MHRRRGPAGVIGLAFVGFLALNAATADAGQAQAGAGERASLAAVVMDQTGRPLADIPVVLVETAGGAKHEMKADASGKIASDGLPAGDYRIEVSKGGFEQVAGHVVLAPGERAQRDIVPRIVSLRHKYGVPSKPGSETPPTQRTVLGKTLRPDPCKTATAGGCLTPPDRLVEAWPVYPPALAGKGGAATVDISARLGTDGFLTDFRANDGADPDCVAAATEALKVWEYSPLRLNGIPQEGRMMVTFTFTR